MLFEKSIDPVRQTTMRGEKQLRRLLDVGVIESQISKVERRHALQALDAGDTTLAMALLGLNDAPSPRPKRAKKSRKRSKAARASRRKNR